MGIMKVSEKQLKAIIKECITNYLNEGGFPDTLKKLNYIKETIGAESMLDSIFSWSSPEYLDKLVQWFEDDGAVSFEN